MKNVVDLCLFLDDLTRKNVQNVQKSTECKSIGLICNGFMIKDQI